MCVCVCVFQQGRRYMSYFVVPRMLTMYRLKAMNGQSVITLLGDGYQQQLKITVLNDKVCTSLLVVITFRNCNFITENCPALPSPPLPSPFDSSLDQQVTASFAGSSYLSYSVNYIPKFRLL